MSVVAPSSVPSPLAGPAGPSRAARATARPQDTPGAFAAALDRSAPDDTAVSAADKPARPRADNDSAPPEPVVVREPAGSPEASVAGLPLDQTVPAPRTTEGADGGLAGTPGDPAASGTAGSTPLAGTPGSPSAPGPTQAPGVETASGRAVSTPLAEAAVGKSVAATTSDPDANPTDGPGSAAPADGKPATSAAGAQPAETATVPTPVARLVLDPSRDAAPVRPAAVASRQARAGLDLAGSPVGTDAAAASAADEGDKTSEPAIPPSPAPDPGRVRDIIERGGSRPASEPGADRAAAPEAAQVDPRTPGPTTRATPPGVALPEPAAPTPAPTLVADEPGAAPAPPAAAPAPEARPAEAAANLGLSTTSRASIETTAQIAAQIVRKLEGRSTRFEMALTPEDLGRVDVSLDIDADGSIAARLAFDNPVAATELRGRVDELRRQLQEAGFSVADDALSFAERDPSSPGQGGAFDRPGDRRAGRAFGAAARLSAEADLAAPPRWLSLALTPERVDMKV